VSKRWAAATVATTPAPNADPAVPFDREPFAQSVAVVASAQSFYTVSPLIALVSTTDTPSGLSNDQLVQQIITTFAVG
jgi:hypothetical protein